MPFRYGKKLAVFKKISKMADFSFVVIVDLNILCFFGSKVVCFLQELML